MLLSKKYSTFAAKFDTKTHMINLNQIFPDNYPDMPTVQDIQVIFKEILNRSDSVRDIVCRIDDESCPYYKHALVLYLADQLDEWYRKQKDIAGFQQGDLWIPYWQEPKNEIRYYVEKYRKEQKAYTYTTTATRVEEIIEPTVCEVIPKPTVSLTPKVVEHLKSSIQQVVAELSAIKNAAQYPHITIHMPVYIIQGDNNGTFAGEQIINNH